MTVQPTTWLSPTSLRLTLTVGGSAAVGARNVTVTNPNAATAVCAGCFTVTAKPTVTVAQPRAPARSGTSGAVIELTGTGLQDGAAVSFAGTGVTVDSVTYVDPTRLDLERVDRRRRGDRAPAPSRSSTPTAARRRSRRRSP